MQLTVIQKNSNYINGLVGEFVLFSATTILLQLSRFGVNIFVARSLGPKQFGIWTAVNLILIYGAITTLGAPNGMNREIPRLTGSGDHTSTINIASTSFWTVFSVSGISAIFMMVFALTPCVSPAYKAPLFWMGSLFFLHQLYGFFQMLLKCHIRFRMMSLQQLIYAFIFPLVVVPTANLWGISGFIIGQSIVAFSLVIFIAIYGPKKIGFFFNWSSLLSLIKIGFPIVSAGILYGFLTTADRWIILSFIDLESLGHYGIAILVLGVLGLLPRIISEQLYPRMAFRYGVTNDKHSLIPLIVKQTLAAGLVTLPVIGLVIIVLPLFVTTYLPQYIPGIPPARILLVGLGFLALSGGVGNFLNTVNKQNYYLVVQAVALFLNVSLGITLVKIGFGLEGIAIASSTTYALYTIMLILVSLRFLRKS